MRSVLENRAINTFHTSELCRLNFALITCDLSKHTEGVFTPAKSKGCSLLPRMILQTNEILYGNSLQQNGKVRGKKDNAIIFFIMLNISNLKSYPLF